MYKNFTLNIFLFTLFMVFYYKVRFSTNFYSIYYVMYLPLVISCGLYIVKKYVKKESILEVIDILNVVIFFILIFLFILYTFLFLSIESWGSNGF